MAIKHAVIKNKLYEVYDASENYVPEIMDNNYSAILMPDGIVYPKVAKSSHAVGYYQQGPFLIFNKPRVKIERITLIMILNILIFQMLNLSRKF